MAKFFDSDETEIVKEMHCIPDVDPCSTSNSMPYVSC